jgi:hypothetical protein
MEVTCSSGTSVYFQRTTRHYLPEDINLHNHRCENLKSYASLLFPPDYGKFQKNYVMEQRNKLW